MAAKTKAHPSQTPALEQKMTNLGMKYEPIGDIELSDLNLTAGGSIAGQTRGYDFDQATVDRYAEAWRRGENFPGIAVAEIDGEPLLQVIAGLQRSHSALSAGLTSIPGYKITDATEDGLMDLAIWTNRVNGLALTKERLESYAETMHLRGATFDAISEVTGLSVDSIRGIVARYKARKVLSGLGIDPATLPKSVQTRVTSLPNNDLIKEAVRLFETYPSITTNDLGDLVTTLNAEKDPDQWDAILARVEADAKAATGGSGGGGGKPGGGKPGGGRRGKGGNKPNARAKLMSATTQLLGLSAQDVADLLTTPAMAKSAIDRLDATMAQCVAIKQAIAAKPTPAADSKKAKAA